MNKKEKRLLKIPELNIKVETEIHDKGKCLKDIKVPKGMRLLKIDEIIFLYDNYCKELNLKNTWEFIEQPFKNNKSYVARFYADSDWASFNCNRDPSYSDSYLGVRFCKEVKK